MTSVVVNDRSALKQKIKSIARARILAIVPDWKQTNLVARGVEIVSQEILVGGYDNLTAQEQADKAAIESIWAMVKAIRSHSDILEADVDAGNAVDLETGWPF